jgi:hypothetical protein
VPSSTSNSEPVTDSALEQGRSLAAEPQSPKPQVRRATIALMVALATVLGMAELAARIAFPRLSHIQRRIVQDQMEVRAIGTPDPNGPPTLLLVGNSLLLFALDYPRLGAALSPDIRPVRYVIENTNYLDWYYGLNRLFSEGVRPSRVALCLNLGQTLNSGILGDYSARHLFLARDLLPAARAARLDNTRTSGLFFAHWSAFYADRATIRNYILNVSDPDYAQVMHASAQASQNVPGEDAALQESRMRLRTILKLCHDYHVDFVLVVPPSLSRRDELLVNAGALENVATEIPIPLGSLGPEFFRDRAHLNEKGAELFTDALARDLRKHAPESR